MRRVILTLPTLVALAGVSALPAAAAPTDIGSPCLATAAPSNVTAVMTARSPANPLPLSPGARGVITRAVFNVPFLGGSTYQTTLKTMHATGVVNQYTVVSQSAAFTVSDAAHGFDVRIPIAAGDLVGIAGVPGTLLCSTGDPADVIGAVAGDQQPGQTATYAPSTGVGIPVVATVEPDADGDGFGDDTQDQCPQSATTQGACPLAKLDSFGTVKRRSILVVVAADETAKVKVTGTTKVKGKKIKLKGGTRTVEPGTLGRFTVRYPKALKAALAGLPPGRSIKVKLTATTTNVIGQVSTDRTSVRVPGTGG